MKIARRFFHLENESLGYLLVSVAALGFSTRSVITKLVYAYDVDPMTFLLMRLYIGVPLFLLALLIMEGRAGFVENAMGNLRGTLIGLVLGGSMFLTNEAIHALPASIATLVVYTYPAMTLLLVFAFTRKIAAMQIVAVGITTLGLMLLLRIDRDDWIGLRGYGLMVGLAGALCFATYSTLSDRMMRGISPLRMSTFSIVGSALAFAPIFGMREYPTAPEVWGLTAILAVFSGFCSFLSFMYGMRILGASRTTILSSVGPLFTLLWAFLLLGEVLDWLQLIGGATIIAGILVLRLRKN